MNLLKNFVFSKTMLESSEKKHLQKKIMQGIKIYFEKQERKFDSEALFSKWLDDYVEALKSLGYFKTYKTFESKKINEN